MTQAKVSDLIAPAFVPVHRALKSGQYAEYWLKGGRGSGKSTFAATEIVLGMIRDPDANAIVFRRTAATLRESAYAEFGRVIDRMGVSDYFRFRYSPLEIQGPRPGQKIMFRGDDDPQKTKSIALPTGFFKYLWFEELSEFPGMDDIRTIKAGVIRGSGSAGAVTIYTYNPPRSTMAWVNAEALLPAPSRMVHASSYLDMPRDWIGDAFVAEADALKATNETAYRCMYLGEAVGTGGQVFDNLDVRAITPDERRAFGATYAGLDFGWYPDPLHFVRCAFDPRSRRLWVFDEWRTVKTSNRDAYEYLTRVKGVTPDEEVIADSAELKSIADLRAYGMRCTGAVKGPGSVRMSMRWLQGLSAIIIDPAACPAAAKEFAQYEYERDRQGNPVDAYPDKDNHAIDAVRYALNRVWTRKGV